MVIKIGLKRCKLTPENKAFLYTILEEYGMEIEYIQGKKNIVSDALSRFPINGNQNTTQ